VSDIIPPTPPDILISKPIQDIPPPLFFRSSRTFNPLSRFDDTPISSLIHSYHP
jgi:hypothetical protein